MIGRAERMTGRMRQDFMFVRIDALDVENLRRQEGPYLSSLAS